MVEEMFEPALLRPNKIRPLLRDEFEQLVNMGAFEDERVELLRGQLVTMSAQEEPHARICAWFATELTLKLDRATYEVRSHTSHAATRDSVPEPDVQILERSLRRRLPRRALLLIEVTESSMYRDRTIKEPIYSENRAPEYWIVDIKRQIVHVHTKPTRKGYGRVVEHKSGGVLRPVKLPSIAIAVDDIPWGPRHYKRPRRKR